MNDSRYSRQERVAAIGRDGQRRLGAARVLVVGLGALGTHTANALARAGIGTLWLCDRDIVDLGNLQRQVLFDEQDAALGTPKAIAAATALRRAKASIAIEPFVAHCSPTFLDALPALPDLVVDGTDNFPTRYLLNDWCRKARRPWIYAGAVGGEGAAMVIRADGPCLRCLWPEAPPGGGGDTCETVGVLEPAIAAVAAFQTAEALKLLTGGATTAGIYQCDVVAGRYGVLGGLSASEPACPVCRGERYPAIEAPEPNAAVLCGRDAVQIDLPRRAAVDLDALATRLRPVVAELERTPFYLRFAADGVQLRVFPSGRTLLFGVHDPLRARALYDRWVGAS